MKQNRLKYIVISILIGLLVGAIVLITTGYNPLEAYGIILNGIFGSPRYISWTIIRDTPIILTGISVAFAFRTGLFNIGAEGQFIIGTIVAALVGHFWNLPPVIHVIVAILMGCLAAAIWGGIAGLLKSKFGINEVISTIMLNWIAFYLNNFVVLWDKLKRPNKDASQRILDTASVEILRKWKATDAGKAFISNNKVFGDMLKTPVNLGIIFAIVAALLIRHILKNTTLGYQLRAVGHNKDAAEYGGIDVSKNMVRSMMIAGAISGLAGVLQVLGVSREIAILASMEGYGFDGIAVALIAGNNPINCIYAGLFFGALKYGGQKIQPAMGAPSEIINIMVGTIVFFIAIPKLIDIFKTRKTRKRGGEVGSIK
jgi:ABC-type uncharacterized transport system permease subunit